MLITYDMSFFQNLEENDQNKIFTATCEKAVKLAIDYFSRLIKIVPKSEQNMRYQGQSGKCGQVLIPQIDKDQGKDSDLHIYLQYRDDLKQEYLARASWCQFLKGLGPTHGRLNFNIAKLVNLDMTDSIAFDDLFQIVVHEMTHILGFTGTSIANWVTTDGQPHVDPIITQEIRGINTKLLATPNVLKFARDYFGCPSLPGMPLENQGGGGSLGSHWEISIIQDEYMNANSSQASGYFSGFTANLLRDTGFYAEINESMEEKTYFGKGQGCEHVLGNCRSDKREYCKDTDNFLCDYYHNGSSECISNMFNEPGCNTQEIYPDRECFNDKSKFNTNLQQRAFGTKFGNNSKCFNATLMHIKLTSQYKGIIRGKCYEYKCSSDGQQITIYVGQKQKICSINLEYITVEEYIGQIQCPENIQEFCEYKRFCKNYCSANGYCLKNKCYCANGFYGEDCSSNVPV
ncbi:leishmanolysin family protein, putative [Ichthyophthirius multifiliis]|uniref:Leishmanolysin family protein, putative n=1 Tax=Ichthyophthirius multifiliis TaxID=5932 RepID=G0R037_ICHMU|nr:leishmanolysin family protein, putative [Ichthyophthirius multifiliis]EGR29170.1 leishmanolysin family protein, putative [Ichthyophthirius multifiliis]|eukprot:XP_004030406.1 leishmanolysin family protein, putative [Ichthyophthirius multifiliis]